MYTGNSIVDYLKSENKDSSMTARKRLAQQYGIANYRGTPQQNTQLLNTMRKGGGASAAPAPAAAAKPAPSSAGNVNLSAYTPSAQTTAKQTAMNNAASAVKNYGPYHSKYQDTIDQLYDQIINQKPFEYDLNKDALYNQYKDQYQVLGKQAMMDTMGQAAALTGGYGNSYASTAGNQAYQGYLQQLNGMIPELYKIALDRYNNQRNDLYRQAETTAGMDDRDYAKYQDAYNKLIAERDFTSNDYNNERNFDYGKFTDARDYQAAQDRYNQEMAYQKQRDKVADDHWAKEFAMQQAAANRSRSSGRSGGSSGRSRSGSSGKSQKKTSDSSSNGSGFFSNKEILALGYGPISESTVIKKVESGEVMYDEKNGTLRRNPNYNNNPGPKLNFAIMNMK